MVWNEIKRMTSRIPNKILKEGKPEIKYLEAKYSNWKYGIFLDSLIIKIL